MAESGAGDGRLFSLPTLFAWTPGDWDGPRRHGPGWSGTGADGGVRQGDGAPTITAADSVAFDLPATLAHPGPLLGEDLGSEVSVRSAEPIPIPPGSGSQDLSASFCAGPGLAPLTDALDDAVPEQGDGHLFGEGHGGAGSGFHNVGRMCAAAPLARRLDWPPMCAPHPLAPQIRHPSTFPFFPSTSDMDLAEDPGSPSHVRPPRSGSQVWTDLFLSSVASNSLDYPGP